MVKADQLLIAMMVLAGDEEIFVVGHTGDIQRLADDGLVERAWDIKLDNGHRPYPYPRQGLRAASCAVPPRPAGNAVTRRIAAATGLSFAHDLHLLTDTYLFRLTPAFWAELLADFADDGPGLPPGRRQEDYYAVYRGHVAPVKFVRL